MSYDNTLRNTGLTGLFNLEPYFIVSKVIRNCPGFGFIRCVIGLEKYHHFLDQSDVKLKPLTTWSRTFSRALGSLVVLLVLIGCCRYFPSFRLAAQSKSTLRFR